MNIVFFILIIPLLFLAGITEQRSHHNDNRTTASASPFSYDDAEGIWKALPPIPRPADHDDSGVLWEVPSHPTHGDPHLDYPKPHPRPKAHKRISRSNFLLCIGALSIIIVAVIVIVVKIYNKIILKRQRQQFENLNKLNVNETSTKGGETVEGFENINKIEGTPVSYGKFQKTTEDDFQVLPSQYSGNSTNESQAQWNYYLLNH